MKPNLRILLAISVCLLIAAWFLLDLGRFFSLEFFKSQQTGIEVWRAGNPWLALSLFTLLYIAISALSLPGAAILTLAAGAVFGLWWGLLGSSIGSTVGATLAFLISRILLHDWVQSRFAEKLKRINQGIEKDGAFYLFTLRLVPVFPFFVINLVMGLTPMKTWTFFWVSMIGMLAGTFVYVLAGTQLAQIDSPSGIFSPGLLASFALLGIFPLLAKIVVSWIKSRKVYAGWEKPSSFDRNLVVIGAGAAGLVSAYIASAVKAKVTLIEKNKMGGDCLNTGCVPSKALIRSAKLLSEIRHSGKLGIKTANADFEFTDIMQRLRKVINDIEPHDSIERYTKLGVDVVTGTAKIRSPWEVEITQTDANKQITSHTLTTKNIIIASGARPAVPPVPGLDKTSYLTSDTIWKLEQLPEKLVILGGGPIGCELAQAFSRLGSKVTILEMLPRLMIREDAEISEIISNKFTQEGIKILTSQKAVECCVRNGEKIIISTPIISKDFIPKDFIPKDFNNAENHTSKHKIETSFDELLIAVGRKANVSGFGAKALGISFNKNGTIETNDYLQTNFPNIYACGDVAGPFQFTHTASHQAWYSAVNALFSPFKKFRADYSVIPSATFVDPQVARVGINEQEAKAQGIKYEITRYGIDDLDRAIADGAAEGVIKVLTMPGKDKILGVTIVAAHASDTISEFVLAMRHNLGLNKILGTIHIYPTFSEANKYAAGNWKRAHAPEKLLGWIERFHRWRRK